MAGRRKSKKIRFPMIANILLPLALTPAATCPAGGVCPFTNWGKIKSLDSPAGTTMITTSSVEVSDPSLTSRRNENVAVVVTFGAVNDRVGVSMPTSASCGPSWLKT